MSTKKGKTVKRTEEVEFEDRGLYDKDSESDTDDEGDTTVSTQESKVKKVKCKSGNGESRARAVFKEDGEDIVMSVKGVDYDSEIDEQPPSSEEDSSEEEEEENGSTSEDDKAGESSNNNASLNSSQRSDVKEADNQQLLEEFYRLQNIMKEKGIITDQENTIAKSPMKSKVKKKGKTAGIIDSESDSTIYQRAVKRGSSSSEDAELIDTHDETINFGLLRVDEADNEIVFNVGKHRQKTGRVDHSEQQRHRSTSPTPPPWDARPGCSYDRNPQQDAARRYEDEIDVRLDKVIRDAEASKARVQEIAGRWRNCDKDLRDKQFVDNIEHVDHNYQFLGSHVDGSLRKRIIDHEYVDFARLIPRDKVKVETDNHLEMVQQNGRTYWVPYADRDNLSVNSYARWDLAFRVYSNIYTSAYPGRATELLQYQHLIYSASQNYIWDNVYTYDIDFWLHMSKHPQRSWAMILQQAWSFRLKDRLSLFRDNRGSNGSGDNGGRPRYCVKYNQGYCEYGKGCKFEHRCSICGKFGHGAFNCRKGASYQHQNHYDSPDSSRHGDKYHYHAKPNRDKDNGHSRKKHQHN